MRKEYLFVKKKDDFCNSIEQFKSMLLSNSRIELCDNQLKIGQQRLEYSINQDNIERVHEVMFFFCIRGMDDESEEQQLKALECADALIRRIIEQYKIFYINTIWDDVSIYYGKALYPQIVDIENLLRKIIYIFMIKNSGSKWVEQSIPKEVKESIQKTQDKSREKVHNMLVDCLYSADFKDLGIFFFANYTHQLDYQKLIRKLKLTENQTKEKIDELIEQYEAKSNWDRYFSEKIDVENLEEKWRKLYGYRNQVAHSKNIDKDDYDNAIRLIQELESAFNECLEHVNYITLTSEECEAVEAVAEKTIERNLVGEVTSGIRNKKLVYEPLESTVVDKSFFSHGLESLAGIHGDLDYSGMTGAISAANIFADRISSIDTNAWTRAVEPLSKLGESINIQADAVSSIFADKFPTIDSNVLVSASEPLTRFKESINIQTDATSNILVDRFSAIDSNALLRAAEPLTKVGEAINIQKPVTSTAFSDIHENNALSAALVATDNRMLRVLESPVTTKLLEIDSNTTQSPIVAKDSIFELAAQIAPAESTKYSLDIDLNKNNKDKN